MTLRPGALGVREAGAIRWSMALVLLVGAGLRVLGVDRPLDHRLANAWREADYTQIARNFYREGLNPIYPRIDWRGDSPGYVEMEFPLLPWLAAVTSRALGYNEAYLRVFAACFSLGALFLFARLAASLLPSAAAVFAVATFAINPLLVKLGNAMQPEPVMIFFIVVLMCCFERWRRRPNNRDLLLAATALCAATLAKPPAGILGFALFVMILADQGRAAFRRPFNYLAAVIAAGPPILWTMWAAHLWRVYGNSLGVSNESHWLTLEVLISRTFVLGNLKWETLVVWTPCGWLLALFALRRTASRITTAWLCYAAVCVFYVLAGGTSGDDWASYYHAASVPPACLLMGVGLTVLLAGPEPGDRFLASPIKRRALAVGLMVGTLAALNVATGLAIFRRDHRDDLAQMRAAAIELARVVPENGLIVMQGGKARDEWGRRVAFNEPMMFAWMDRKGFSYPRNYATVEKLDRIAARGGRYWIASKGELKRNDFAAVANAAYHRLAASSDGSYVVYDLKAPGEADHASHARP